MSNAVLEHLTPDFQPLPDIPFTVRGYDGPRPGPSRDDVEAFQALAQLLSTAQCTIQREYQRRPGDCATLLLRAKALNIELGIAIDHIYINDDGKAGLSAQLIAYLLRRAGIDWDVVKNPAFVEMSFFRPVTIITRTGRMQNRRKRIGTTRFDMLEAVTAKIADTHHWRTWPIACMWARCIARASREYFSSITLGMAYTGEELNSGAATGELRTAADPVRGDVDELIQQALSESATPELIKSDIVRRARAAKLLHEHAGGGETLQQRLLTIRAAKVKHCADQAMAVPADRAMTAAGYTSTPAGDAWKQQPVGDGVLPCGCPAAVLLTDQHLQRVCRGVLAG